MLLFTSLLNSVIDLVKSAFDEVTAICVAEISCSKSSEDFLSLSRNMFIVSIASDAEESILEVILVTFSLAFFTLPFWNAKYASNEHKIPNQIQRFSVRKVKSIFIFFN